MLQGEGESDKEEEEEEPRELERRGRDAEYAHLLLWLQEANQEGLGPHDDVEQGVAQLQHSLNALDGFISYHHDRGYLQHALSASPEYYRMRSIVEARKLHSYNITAEATDLCKVALGVTYWVLTALIIGGMAALCGALLWSSSHWAN